MSTILSPLSQEQIELFNRLTASLNSEQLAWISGYLAGFSAQKPGQLAGSTEAIAVPAESRLTILYGSRTGNGEGLASRAMQQATELGIEATLKSMAGYKTRDLQSEKNLLVIVSTHGEGVPPFQARELYEFIHGKRAPKLDGVNFAVLALGDSSYFHFCKTGKDFDEQLEKLGAKRAVQRVDCDVDFETVADSWLKSTLPLFAGEKTTQTKPALQFSLADTAPILKKEAHTKKNPFLAPVFEKINLHGKGSDRQTLHIELNTDNAPGLDYQPGDAAGVYPLNSPELVSEVLAVT